jgi:succinate dehydrogenase / fumarate reductase flavoprotein subunit
VDSFHRKLGEIMWEHCGMARNEAGLQEAVGLVAELREAFFRELRVPGGAGDVNQSLQKAYRVQDFLDFADLMARDALERRESCGGHFREEYQTEDGEARRDDEGFCHVAAWEYRGDASPRRQEEPLRFENVALSQRSYK